MSTPGGVAAGEVRRNRLTFEIGKRQVGAAFLRQFPVQKVSLHLTGNRL
nr:MAG TPA: hypothetical protein [Caudoviricetes sp.]